MATRRTPLRARSWQIALLSLAMAVTSQHEEAGAQSRVPESLEGNWVRLDSNYDPNDQMRIRIEGGVATLTYVPSSGHEAFRTGQSLWVDIRPDGSLKVRGSDGGMYPGTLRLENEDDLRVDVLHDGPGNEQAWRRAGPTIDGEWVRIDAGDPADGMRIRVERDQASIRFLPPASPRNLRVGGRLWREIRSRGEIEVLASDGQYRSAILTLEGEDRLWLAGEGLAGRQLWVRPETVEAERAALAEAARAALGERPQDPRAPTAGLQLPEGLPTIGRLPTTPPVLEPGPVACFASSLRKPEGSQRWNWALSWAEGQDTVAERLGLLDYGGPWDRRNYITTDLEYVSLPSLGEGFSSIAQRRTDVSMLWEERRDLTGAQFEAQDSSFRVAGLRPTDIEAYETPQGIRYAGVWVTNVEGVDWWVGHALTNDEYTETFEERRNAGFRLMDMEAYTNPEGRRFAAIWYRSCDNTNWRQWRGMNSSEYQQTVDSLDGLGYRIVDFESYRTPNGQRYAGIWEQIDGPSVWAVRSGRTLNGYLNFHRRYTDLGFRLVDFEAYETDGGLRYAGVWAENDAKYRFALRPIVDDSVEAYRTLHSIPGISVAIIQGGELIYSQGFGWADSAAAREAHSLTVYPTASVAKVIGGTLAARLQVKGLVDLSRPTADYIDSLPAHHTHTVEQLLAKTGCVPHYPEGREPPEQSYRWQIDALRTVWADSLLAGCTPGMTYHYSTHGFTYLGAVLEAVTGKRLEQLIQEEIAGPFGLPSLRTAQGTAPRATPGPRDYHLSQAYAYDSATGRSTLGRHEDASWKVLGGGLQMDVRDLASFGWQHLSADIVSATTRDSLLWAPLTMGLRVWDTTSALRLIAPPAPPVGLAWVVRTTPDRAEHGGSAGGARTDLAVYRTEDLVIAIMSNQSSTPVPQGTTGVHWLPILTAQLRRIVLANPPPARSP